MLRNGPCMKRLVLISTALHIGLFAGALALVPRMTRVLDPRPPGIELEVDLAPLIAPPPPPAPPTRVDARPPAPVVPPREPEPAARAIPTSSPRAARTVATRERLEPAAQS